MVGIEDLESLFQSFDSVTLHMKTEFILLIYLRDINQKIFVVVLVFGSILL